MEPLDDHELKELLSHWEPPATPPRLRARVFGRSRRWRGLWLLPVAACLVVVLYPKRRDPPPVQRTLTFRELQPVQELRPRILRGPHASN